MKDMATSLVKIKLLLLDPDEDDSLLLEVGAIASDMREALVLLPQLAGMYERAIRETLEQSAAEQAALN